MDLRRTLLISLLLVASSYIPSYAAPLADTVASSIPSLGGERAQAIKDIASSIANDSPQIAELLFHLPSIQRSPIGKFFEDANIKLKGFDSTSNDKSSSFGFSYDYAKSKKLILEDDADVFSGMRVDFNAKGNVAFKKSENPNDFLDTKIGLTYFRSTGGTVRVDDGDVKDELNTLETSLAGITNYEDLKSNEDWRRFLEIIGIDRLPKIV